MAWNKSLKIKTSLLGLGILLSFCCMMFLVNEKQHLRQEYESTNQQTLEHINGDTLDTQTAWFLSLVRFAYGALITP